VDRARGSLFALGARRAGRSPRRWLTPCRRLRDARQRHSRLLQKRRRHAQRYRSLGVRAERDSRRKRERAAIQVGRASAQYGLVEAKHLGIGFVSCFSEAPRRSSVRRARGARAAVMSPIGSTWLAAAVRMLFARANMPVALAAVVGAYACESRKKID